MTAAANTTTATAPAIRPHGRCWVTTLTGGRVRPLVPAPVRCVDGLLEPDPPREAPPDARPFSGLGSLATTAPPCAAVPGNTCTRVGPAHLAGGCECRCGGCATPALDRFRAR